MSIEKPILKLYNTDFTLVALIDDYQQAQIEHNLYSAGAFSVSINYNIPNAKLFKRGLFLQFGNNARDFCVIQSVENSIGSSGKGSEYITVSGYDCRYLFKRRIIKNLNSNDTWSMTAKGELCIRSLVADQCGVNAEEKRKLPITNIIPDENSAIGSTYSVSEAYSNLYGILVTIATQSEIGWAVEFNGSSLNLVVYQGENKSNNVFFSTDFESLANGKYKDSNDSYSNSVYIGGKGTGSERDIYEGEVDEPEGLDRFESYDNQSSMTTEEEYEEKARSILSQYGQTITVSGAGLAKCPYVFRKQYNIGDVIKLSFSGKSANTQILSVSESWAKGSYSLSFNFGKPVNTLSDQLNIMLRKIQDASNKSSAATSVKWYTLPDDTKQDISDVTFDTLGFTGEIASGGSTFTLGFNSEGVGCKTYIIYIKNLTGSDELTLTTGTDGAENVTFNQGTYIATITIDTEGNVIAQSVTEATHAITADTATNAVNADTATNAENSNTLEGESLETVYKMSNAGGVCSTAIDTAAKTVSIPGFTLYTGVRVSVLFSNRNTANNPTLNVNSTGAIEIRTARANGLVALPRKNAKWRNNSSAFYEMWQAYTILNLIYNGTYWVVEGNPVLESYHSTTNSYVVYADGTIEQWGTFTYSTTARDFLVPFTQKPSMTCIFNSNSSGVPQYREFPRPISATQWNQLYGNASVSNGTWYAVGY